MNASTQVLAFAPISAVAEFVRKKELSPVDLVRASLARIEALDSKLNSFYTLFRDGQLRPGFSPYTLSKSGPRNAP